MQSERRFSVPTVEVRHYPIGGDPTPVDSAHLVSEIRETEPMDQSSSMGELTRVQIVRLGSEIVPGKFHLLDWARRRARSARRFFAGV
jgi:hypothetical protein